ncbi:MAG: hypothetical protein E7652_08540 [Ruminococcaceae bacterium]|nr:hypothetical protein [Oscillospiraceae bacterium]
MKALKLTSFILALILSVGLVSCNKNSKDNKETGAKETNTTVNNEAPPSEDEPEEEEKINELLNPATTLPAGSRYHSRGALSGIIASEDGKTEFPVTANGDEFYYTDYKYTYTDGAMFDGVAGWTVTVADDKKSETILTAVLESINGDPVVSVNACFKDCVNLQYAPAIPESVVTMTHAFYGCAALTAAPVIPESVKHIDGAFYGCLSMKGEVEINATPETFADCFYATGYELTLKGACENKADLAATGVEGMIKY